MDAEKHFTRVTVTYPCYSSQHNIQCWYPEEEEGITTTGYGALPHLLNIYKGLSEMESELMNKKQMSKKWWMRWIEILEKNRWDFFILEKEFT